MKEYKVEIKETLAMTVTAEADSLRQARQIVEQKWKDGEYVLDADHFQGATFTSPQNRNYER